MQFDQASAVTPRVALNTAAIASNVTTNGIIIDTQGFNALTFLLNVGARTDGTFAGSIQHGDTADLSDAATPAADDLIAPTGGNSINAAQTIKKFGYVGNKRYVRLNVTSTGVTSGATVGATALLGRPTVGPVA